MTDSPLLAFTQFVWDLFYCTSTWFILVPIIPANSRWSRFRIVVVCCCNLFRPPLGYHKLCAVGVCWILCWSTVADVAAMSSMFILWWALPQGQLLRIEVIQVPFCTCYWHFNIPSKYELVRRRLDIPDVFGIQAKQFCIRSWNVKITWIKAGNTWHLGPGQRLRWSHGSHSKAMGWMLL